MVLSIIGILALSTNVATAQQEHIAMLQQVPHSDKDNNLRQSVGQHAIEDASACAPNFCVPHRYKYQGEFPDIGPESMSEEGRWNACKECTPSKFSNGSTRPHLLFLHVQHTGGSSLECATVGTLQKQGLWSNLGHMGQETIEGCSEQCGPVKIVMGVRNPYEYWKSYYLWQHDIGTISADLSFDEFVQEDIGWSKQVDRWRHRFGDDAFARNAGPDYVLRLEELDDDLTALTAAFELPPLEVPHMNCATKRDGPSSKTAFTKEMLDMINKREGDMFQQRFGYAKTEKPFELD